MCYFASHGRALCLECLLLLPQPERDKERWQCDRADVRGLITVNRVGLELGGSAGALGLL